MNEEQRKERTNKKIKLIVDFAESLQIEMSAKQVLTDGRTIESVVYFIDTEKYPEEPTVVKEQKLSDDELPKQEESQEIKNDEPTTVQ